MNPNPITIQVDGTLSEAIKIMRERRVDSLLVTDENNVLKGLLNVEMIDRGKNMETVVRDVMLTDLKVVHADTLLREATRNILIGGLKYVAVVDEDRRLIGLITRTNLVDIVYDSIWGDTESQLLGNV